MRGLKITVPGANFSKYVDIIQYPVAQDLSSLFFLGGDAVASGNNLAPGFPDAPAVGANITYQPGYALFTGAPLTAANFIRTSEFDNDSAAFTRVAVYQNMSNIQRAVFGLFAGASTGSGILSNQSFIATGSAVLGPTLYGTAIAPSFRFVAQTYSGTTLTTYTARGGELLAQTTTGTRAANVGTADRIGGEASSNTFSGDLRVASVAKHRSALTANQIALIYAFYRLEMARKGLELG